MYSSPAHPLQQDILQSAPSMTPQQFDAASQLMLASTHLQVSFQEAWPGGGRVCLWDPALLTSAVSSDGGGTGNDKQHDLTSWLRHLLLDDCTATQTRPMETGNKILPFQDISLQENQQTAMCIAKSNITELETFRDHKHRTTSHHPQAHVVHDGPHGNSGAPRRCNVSREPVLGARVDSLHAEDLGYHHRGTFHWDPLINSSSPSPDHRGGGGGSSGMSHALTFIVQYFTPQWVM